MDILAAVIATAMVLIFLGWLAVTIAAAPLVIVIVLGAVLMLIDTFDSLRKRENGT